jgi:hypothetical protein
MINRSISVESAPLSNKQKELSAVVKLNIKFAGIAKKRNQNTRPSQQNFLSMSHMQDLLIPMANPKSKPIQ